MFGVGLAIAGVLVIPGTAHAADGPSISVDLGIADPVCGTAWGQVDLTDDGRYQEKTGFKGVSAGAVSYAWIENIYVYSDDTLWDHYVVRQSGGLGFRKAWTGQHTDDLPVDGPIRVDVYIGGSYWLGDGSLCTAGGTSTATFI